MNRGQARRPVFKTRAEIRYFQSRLAREVRRGELEVHAYCFLTTHFHMLVRSPNGGLSEAMRRVENPFVRWFNRRHKRDGALFRGRFASRRVQSSRYYENVASYIDNNAVAAGLASTPAEYPHGSAYLHARNAAPRWLEGPTSTAAPLNSHASWVVERRLARVSDEDALDDLVGASSAQVQAWMERKTRLADGPSDPSCLTSPIALRDAVEVERRRIGAWKVTPRIRCKDAWSVLELGLSREVVGLSTAETSAHFTVARSTAGNALQEHRQLMLCDAKYAERAAEVVRVALALTFDADLGRMNPIRLKGRSILTR